MFYAAELDVYAPGLTGTAPIPAWGISPVGVYDDPVVPESYETIRVSDQGYRTRTTDTPSAAAYPPLLVDAFAIDRAVNLDPTSTLMSASWGRLRLSNANGQFDGIAQSRNSDGRAIRIFRGEKGFDAGRDYYTDPAYSSLVSLFQGIMLPWMVSESSLDIPLRDATYWLDRPLQSATYGGTGGYDGDANVAGLPKPKARGGTSLKPISNIEPVLIDPTNRIYQYNDAPGTVVAISEGGLSGSITFQADTTNLYSGTTNAGQYRTDNSRGLFQLGSSPVRTITADVTGAFPAVGALTQVAAIARYLLVEDCVVPSANIDVATFISVGTTYNYQAGFYWGPQPITGLQAVGEVLNSAGIKLISKRNGNLAPFPIVDPASFTTPVATFNVSNTERIVPVALPSVVSPPTYRVRIGYQRNWRPGIPDLNPTISDARRAFLAAESRFGAWVSTDTSWRRPNDPPPILGGLYDKTAADSVASRLGLVWGVRRRLLAVTLPVSVAAAREIGDAVRITWPADDLRDGKPGLIVGEQFRSVDSSVTLLVLV